MLLIRSGRLVEAEAAAVGDADINAYAAAHLLATRWLQAVARNWSMSPRKWPHLPR